MQKERMTSTQSAPLSPRPGGEDELDFGEDDLFVALPAPAPAPVSVPVPVPISSSSSSKVDAVVSLPPSPTSNAQQDDDDRSSSSVHPTAAAPSASPAPVPTPAAPAKNRLHDPTLDEHGKLLPPGWTSRVSSANDIYYKEETTGQSNWDIPAWPHRDRTRSPDLPKDRVRKHDPSTATTARGDTHTTSEQQQDHAKPSRIAVHPDRLNLVSVAPLLNDQRRESSSLPRPALPHFLPPKNRFLTLSLDEQPQALLGSPPRPRPQRPRWRRAPGADAPRAEEEQDSSSSTHRVSVDPHFFRFLPLSRFGLGLAARDGGLRRGRGRRARRPVAPRHTRPVEPRKGSLAHGVRSARDPLVLFARVRKGGPSSRRRRRAGPSSPPGRAEAKQPY